MSDPFEMGLFGGSPKTATEPALPCTSATTALISTKTDESAVNSLGRAKRSRSGRKTETPFSCGESSLMTADSPASTAPYSEMNRPTYRRSLSDRLTPSLISAGLVKGITPTSIRQQSGQPIRVLAFDTPDGGDAG